MIEYLTERAQDIMRMSEVSEEKERPLMETKSTRDALLLRGVVLLAALAAALIMLTFGPVSHAQAAQTTCQDNSKSDCWAYDRWVLQNYSGYSGGSQVNNAYAGRSASFSFKGTSVKWITSRGSDYGKTAVYLDGREVKVYDGYASSASHKVVGFSRSNLANKKHTIKLVNTGKKTSRPAVPTPGSTRSSLAARPSRTPLPG